MKHMKYNNAELRILEAKIIYLLTDIFQQNLTGFSKLQIRALLLKHKYLHKYIHSVINIGIQDTVGFIGRDKFPVYAATTDDDELMDYLIPYVLFFMEDNYEYMKRLQIEQGLIIQEIFNTIGKQRLAIFVSGFVNNLYNETIIKTSAQANIHYFRFVAVIDERTSVICRSLNQTILSEFQEYFFPPLHPHCRSHLEPVLGRVDQKRVFNGKMRKPDIRRLSWYKATFACNLDNLNIDKMLMAYL